MQEPLLVQADLLQLVGQFLQVVVHLLGAQLFTDQLLKDNQREAVNLPITPKYQQ